MGLNSNFFSYSQCRSWEKTGDNVSILPGNQLMVTDHDLTGFSDPRSNRAFSVWFVYEFTGVPSILPAYQVVVIQQLSIG